MVKCFCAQNGYAAPRFVLAAVVTLVAGSATLVAAEFVFRTAAPQWSDRWKMWRIDPIHAVGLQPSIRNATVRGVSGEFVFQFSTNAQGLRMDYDLSVEPLPGAKRILIVGDSFTFSVPCPGPGGIPENVRVRSCAFSGGDFRE